MADRPFGSDPDSYGAKLRAKGVQIGAGITSHKGTPGSNAENNQWEKGIASQPRPGGTRMPFLDQHGSTIPVKKFSEMTKERSSHEARQRANTHT